MDTNERNFLKLIAMVVLVIMVLSSNYNYRNKLIKEREMTMLHIPKYNGVHGDTTKYMFEEHTTIEEDFNAANPATAVGNAFTKKQQEQLAKKSNLSKEELVNAYVKRYYTTAVEEMKLYNIPASITLAQGIIESNAGQSKLSVKENNHFGIKCKANSNHRCANYADDDPDDMFRVFNNAWESYREHSKLLTGNRYKHLTKLSRKDYKSWARGLQRAGYATNKNYAKLIISIVEKYKLYKYDR
jgi:flagellum-specific peptidoglycan hydrolase FlgJ